MSTQSNKIDYINSDTLPDEGRDIMSWYDLLPDGRATVYYRFWKGKKSKRLQITIKSQRIDDINDARKLLKKQVLLRSLKNFKNCIAHYRKHKRTKGMEACLNELEKRFNPSINEHFPATYTEFIYQLSTGTSERTKKPYTVATISKYKATIRAVINFCFFSGFIKERPAIKYDIKKGKRRDRILTEEEKKRLLNTLRREDSYLYPLIYFRLKNKARLTDLLKLTTENWNPFKKWISFYASKTNEDRDTPSRCTEIDDYLYEYFNSLPAGVFLFHHKDDPFKPIGDFRSHYKGTLRRAKIKNYRFKDMEHDGFSYMIEKGYSKELLKKLGTSFTDDSYETYDNTSIEDELEKIRHGISNGRLHNRKTGEV